MFYSNYHVLFKMTIFLNTQISFLKNKSNFIILYLKLDVLGKLFKIFGSDVWNWCLLSNLILPEIKTSHFH